MAYFRLVSADEQQVRYICGPDQDQLTIELVFERTDPPTVARPELGYTARKAAGKILSLLRERGDWPERGASIS